MAWLKKRPDLAIVFALGAVVIAHRYGPIMIEEAGAAIEASRQQAVKAKAAKIEDSKPTPVSVENDRRIVVVCRTCETGHPNATCR